MAGFGSMMPPPAPQAVAPAPAPASPRDRAIASLPPDHVLGMRVPKGGSDCSKCEYLSGPNQCGNPGFVKWNGGNGRLPAPADEYCCDLYEQPGEGS